MTAAAFKYSSFLQSNNTPKTNSALCSKDTFLEPLATNRENLKALNCDWLIIRKTENGFLFFNKKPCSIHEEKKNELVDVVY